MIEVTCAIIENEHKILIAQRSETMRMPLKWEFPGGKVIENESYETCIVREIKEEFDIVIKPIVALNANVHDYGNSIIKLIPFICEYNAGHIKITEHKCILWVTPSELIGLDWCEADIPIVQSYLSYINQN